MSTQAVKEVLDKVAGVNNQNLKLVPMVVADDTPLTVNLNGDTSAAVSARSLTGEALAIGETGFALWAPPLPPLVFLATDADTGWVDLTYNGGFTSANGGQAAYRKIGNQVFLKGGADKTAGDYTTTAAAVANIPAAARPAQTERFASYGTLGRLGRIEITTAGDINVAVPNNVDPDSPFGWIGLSHTFLTD